MKITALSFCTFRSHTEPEGYAFGDVTYITGDNGAGKTTMAHGVAYALYGVSFFGEQAIERLMSQGAEGTQVRLDFTDQAADPHPETGQDLPASGFLHRPSGRHRPDFLRQGHLSFHVQPFLSDRTRRKGARAGAQALEARAPW